MKKYILLICLSCISYSYLSARILYVQASNANTGDGLSWGSAFQSVQEAINTAVANDSIWVAEGIYYGGFSMKQGVNVYGGFNGTETTLDKRDFSHRNTVLDGSKNNRVLLQPAVFSVETVWDGFIIQKGTSPGSGTPSGVGVFIRENGVLRNCIIRQNIGSTKCNGGGVYMDKGGLLENCQLSENTSGNAGGGVALGYGGTVRNCHIEKNTAKVGGGIYVNIGFVYQSEINHNTTTGDGAGMYLYKNAYVEKCTIHDNDSQSKGGGIYAIDGQIINSEIFANKASLQGAGIYSVPPAKYPNKTNYFQEYTQYQLLPKSETDKILVGDDFINVAEWREFFNDSTIKNRGINAETTNLLLERIEEIASGKPQCIFIYSGIRDILKGTKNAEIAANMHDIIAKIQSVSSHTQIYLISILPVSNEFSLSTSYTGKQAVIKELNTLYANIAKEQNCTYIDIYTEMKKDNSDWIIPTYTMDGFNLSGNGYVKMTELLKKSYNK